MQLRFLFIIITGKYLRVLNLRDNTAFKDVNSVVNSANRSIGYTCHRTTLSVTVSAAAWRGEARDGNIIP